MTTPPGTPMGDRNAPELAPVWCAHGHRWTPTTAGYAPDIVDEAHPDVPARDVGSIPPTCQPVQAFDPAQYPNTGPAAVRSVMRGE